jgi:hypothetical protein
MRAADELGKEKDVRSVEQSVREFGDCLKIVRKFAMRWRSKALAARARRLGKEGRLTMC